MTAWTSDELREIESADELHVASLRRDGTLRDPVTIWVVRHGDAVYIRSVNGPGSGWFRGVQQHHQGHIEAGGVERDVDFVDAPDEVADEIDDAYRAKYSYFPTGLNDIVRPEARSTTIKLVPRSASS